MCIPLSALDFCRLLPAVDIYAHLCTIDFCAHFCPLLILMHTFVHYIFVHKFYLLYILYAIFVLTFVRYSFLCTLLSFIYFLPIDFIFDKRRNKPKILSISHPFFNCANLCLYYTLLWNIDFCAQFCPMSICHLRRHLY